MNKYTTNEKEEAAVLVKLGLDEVAKAGAQRMLSAALDAEVDDYLSYLQNLHDEKGHALAVRNGRAQERTLTLKVGPIQVKAPRVHDRRPGHTFSSSILPPYLRRSPQLETALPILYLKGLSTPPENVSLSPVEFVPLSPVEFVSLSTIEFVPLF
jgi:putative transposase